jgi:two-component system chemotaxis sensor kinase CheA
MITPFQKAFMEEAQEIFESLENDLVTLEINTSDSELVNKIFRGLHTLKGSGAMFGFQRLSTFVHELETLYDLVRNDKIVVTPGIISMSLESVDFMKMLRDEPDNQEPEREKKFIDAIHAFFPADEATSVMQGKGSETSSQKKTRGSNQRGFRIYYKPDRDIFIKGLNPVVLFRNLDEMGRCFYYADVEELPPIGEINPEWCYVCWTCILITEADIDAVKDVFIFAEGSGELSVNEIFSSDAVLEEESIPLIGDILLSKGDITKEAIEEILNGRKLFGERAVEMGLTSKEKVESALFEQKTIQNIKKEMITRTTASSIRVQNEKLDVLTNGISELVTL